MAGAKNHDFHILDPDIWPLVGAFSGLTFTSGMVLFMHDMSGAHLVLGLGIAGLIATFWGWFSKIVNEAQRGDHTPVVQLHLRYGMILFIASEVMFFVGWFWSWFDFALFPAPIEIIDGVATNFIGQEGAAALKVFPYTGLHVLDPFDLPLLNTLILLCSGTTVTWAHHSLIHGDREGLKKGLWATVLLGALFSAIQIYEYGHASFGFGGNNAALIFSTADTVPQTRPTPSNHTSVTGLGIIAPEKHSVSERAIQPPLPPDSIKVRACAPFDAATLTPNQRRRLSRITQMAILAARRSHAADPSKRLAVAVGTGFGCLDEGAIFIENLITKDEAEPMPTRFPGSVHNAPAGQVAIDLGARGLNSAPTMGEISFESALWQRWLVG